MKYKTNKQYLAEEWHRLFNLYAGDLYPGRYTEAFCLELAEQAIEIKKLAKKKGSIIVAHNYQYPEIQEVARYKGDSLGLCFKVKQAGAQRVDFVSVAFMGATAKIITGDATRVFIQDEPKVIGCSLVFGTSYDYLERWKQQNPDGVLVTYINSDVYTKSISDYISTSSNTAKIIVRASKEHPNSKILVLPDKFLGYVMKAQAVELGVDKNQVEVYEHAFAGQHACCYVHEKIGDDAPERALEEYPDAELLIHPECGCASSCIHKLQQGLLPRGRVYYLSTEQMLERARTSDKQEFVVATEIGMLWRLRREIPQKKFYPVSLDAQCKYMKGNTLAGLLRSLQEDRFEIVLTDDVDPKLEEVRGNTICINRLAATKAFLGIEKMLTT